jgi:hypothetical protein
MPRYMIDVRGDRDEWGIFVPERMVAGLRADGIDVKEVVNVIPYWLPSWAVHPWCRAQDIWDWPSRWWRGGR